MDKTLRYQNMCKTASEIQALWQPGKGDFYISQESGIHCWITETGDRHFRNGFGILREEDGVIRLEQRYWLPRQNQIMELAQVPGVPFRDMTFRFHEWAGNPYDRREDPERSLFITQEQLWLAFLMQIRFSKRWKGSDWESVTFQAE